MLGFVCKSGTQRSIDHQPFIFNSTLKENRLPVFHDDSKVEINRINSSACIRVIRNSSVVGHFKAGLGYFLNSFYGFLNVIQLLINAILSNQFIVCAAFGNFTFVYDQNFMRVLNGA
jgi:hypothetical protein